MTREKMDGNAQLTKMRIKAQKTKREDDQVYHDAQLEALACVVNSIATWDKVFLCLPQFGGNPQQQVC